MSMVTNTVSRYAVSNVREDLSDVIYSISPVDVPFMSNIGRDSVKNSFFEWQTDSLAAAVTTNAQLEGDDVAGTTDDRAQTDRVGNYVQISRKLIQVSGSIEAMNQAGTRSQLAFEMAKASAELKRDMEATLTSNQVANAGGTTTARKTAALGSWLITNSFKGTGTTAAAPVMSSGSTNLSGYPATAAVAGTSRAFTKELLKQAAQAVWTEGGKLKMAMMGPYQKTVFSTFTGIATQYRDVPAGQQAQIVGAADVFLSDFGEIAAVPNRFMPDNIVYLVDPEYASISYLRNFRTETLARTGDSEKRMLIVEYGLRCRQQKAMAAIRDLATS